MRPTGRPYTVRMSAAEGNLTWKPLSEGLDLVAAPVAEAARAGRVPGARVAPIDGTLADTAAFVEAYGVPLEASANCVVVEGRRGDAVTPAAVLVLATDRADINKTVRKHLDARKVSFADQTATEEATGMTSGGITPVGLPDGWRLLIDRAVLEAGDVVIGGGVRDAKLLVPAAQLAELPRAEVLDLVAR